MFSYRFLPQVRILTKRRGVSQIIASLFMLAIVATFGSVLLLQGMTGINDFNSFLGIFEQSETLAVQESIVIEHVRFNNLDAVDENNDPIDVGGASGVNIWIRNNGATSVTIDTITLVKVDTQDLIINKDLTTEVFVKDFEQITIDASDVSLPLACSDWTDCQGSTYRLSVTTSRGNSFITSVQPFNI